MEHSLSKREEAEGEADIQKSVRHYEGGVEEERVTNGGEESPRINGNEDPGSATEEEEAPENELFPSARSDPAIAAARKSPQRRRETEDDNDSSESLEQQSKPLTRKRKSNSSHGSVQNSVRADYGTSETRAPVQRRRIKLDPEAQRESERAAAKRYWAHNVVQRATFQENLVDREFSLEQMDEESDCTMEFYPSSRFSNELLEDLIALTRKNMKTLYDGSGSAAWAWNDTRKRGELRNDRMRWILLRSKTLPGIETSESGERGIVGFVAFRFAAEVGIPLTYLHELQLSEAVQGKGYGRLLTEQVEKISRECQMQLIMLTVFSSNVAAMNFYKKLGFNIDEASPGPCYNLMDDSHPKSPYEIMSKVLDSGVLAYKCSKCSYRCRFADTLQQHEGFEHNEPWPFPCKVEGCHGGTVHAHQLMKHTELKHSLPQGLRTLNGSTSSAAPSSVSETTSEASSTAAGNPEQNYVNTRIMLQSDGRRGTVVKLGDKGFYTVRMDGPMLETITCRASAFVGHQSIPVKKKERDADYELALKLQYEDGWARKSSRLSKTGSQ